MSQQFTAQYFAQSGQVAGFGVNVLNFGISTATLSDADLIRGDDTTEVVTAPNGFVLFNGLKQVNGIPTIFGTQDDGEVTTTVRFTDGSSLAGVLALYDGTSGPYGSVSQQFLLDVDALAAAGKSLGDVTNVQINAFVDHDLSWADFGFAPTTPTAPKLNLVQGTAGNDRLIGTTGDDLIRGGGDDDRLTGRAGADTFVFGAEARDGDRDRDVITDFDVSEDTIVFEAGAQIRLVEERNGNLFIQLEGDRDTITVLNANLSAVANFVFTEDIFAA